MNTSISDGNVWPKAKYAGFKIIFSNQDEIEQKLRSIFKIGYPVIFSSGRSAITTTLKLFYAGNTVRLYPYASQCVVKSVIKAGLIPITPLNFSTLDISYNQWGNYNSGLSVSPFIEDSVDSFYPMGAPIFKSGANFEIWSFSKIFGMKAGAVLWCKNKEDSCRIKEIMKQSRHLSLMLLRLACSQLKNSNKYLYNLWEYFEFKNQPLFTFEYGKILNKVENWERIYSVRLEKYYQALSDLNIKKNDYLNTNRGVIPVVIEIPFNAELNSNVGIRILHRITSAKKVEKVTVFAYQQSI